MGTWADGHQCRDPCAQRAADSAVGCLGRRRHSGTTRQRRSVEVVVATNRRTSDQTADIARQRGSVVDAGAQYRPEARTARLLRRHKVDRWSWWTRTVGCPSAPGGGPGSPDWPAGPSAAEPGSCPNAWARSGPLACCSVWSWRGEVTTGPFWCRRDDFPHQPGSGQGRRIAHQRGGMDFARRLRAQCRARGPAVRNRCARFTPSHVPRAGSSTSSADWYAVVRQPGFGPPRAEGGSGPAGRPASLRLPRASWWQPRDGVVGPVGAGLAHRNLLSELGCRDRDRASSCPGVSTPSAITSRPRTAPS